MNRFCLLPDEVLVSILELVEQEDLYACTLVDLRFYHVTNPLLWRKPILLDEDTTRRFLDCLTNAQHSVRRWIQTLTLTGLYWTDTELLVLMDGDMQHLDTLMLLFTTHISDAGMQFVARQCSQLKQLHLCHLPVTQRTMDAIGEHCRQLAKLHVYDCERLGSATFAALRHCPLDTINIVTPCPALQSDKAVEDMLGFQGLGRLQLLHFGSPSYLHRVFAAATNSWPLLNAFTLHGYKDTNKTCGPLIPFLQAHPRIKHLVIKKSFLAHPTLQALAALGYPPLTGAPDPEGLYIGW